SRFHPQFFAKMAPLVMVVGLILLLLVAIPGIGTKVMGARRWLIVPGVKFQPAELIKLIEIVYLSLWLQAKKVTLLQFGIFTALVGGLIMLEPDMGTTLVVVALAITMYFLAGYPLRHFVLVGGVGIVVGIIFIVTSSYRLDRVKTFFNPTIDPQGSSYHIRQVLLALGSGGMTGVGIGRSRQKYEYLPEATTDSIFAVAGEELGFIGAGLLILAFLYLLSLIFQLATHTHDSYSKLLVAGVGAWFSLQFILNLAAMVALTPLTGVPLPLVSYGGSALVTMLAGIGIVLSVARTEKL
ncbi:MAG: Bacterial cell division membrane protein, partial [Microgenomates group bacterium GW2011_GWA1_46_7]